MHQVAIIGDGQMGLVMADALCEAGAAVRVWGPFPEPVRELAATRRSPERLPDFHLPEPVLVTADGAEALASATMILNAIPTQHIRSVWRRLAPQVPAVPVICVSKGIETGTLLTPSQVIEQVLAEAGAACGGLCALSGPTIARELARRLPATMVAASDDGELARAAQDLLSVRWLRIYRLDDRIGVELAGATKNVIALAAGMIDGLEAGANAKSALLARGLAEIARLGTAMGARVETFFGVAGVGDLATTCFSPHGRNRTCGERLGRGEALESILASMPSVVEGVPTTEAVCALAARHDVSMPIAEAVRRILAGELTPADAIDRLMQREPKAERVG